MHFYSFSSYLQSKYPFPVYKATVDAGFICPNMDGTKGLGGCTFCNNASFSPSFNLRSQNILQQIDSNIQKFSLRRKKIASKNPQFIAYFQSFSGTYGEPSLIKEWYLSALSHPRIIGLSVGTRCDCLPESILDIFRDLCKNNQEIWVELGVESTHDKTLNYINRGHSFLEVQEAVKKLQGIPNLKICLHLIHGLPFETKEMMLESVKKVNALNPDAVKFHHLEIVKDTVMQKQFQDGLFSVLTKSEYFELLKESLKYLNSNIIVQRMFSFCPSDMLIAPLWSYNNLNEEFRDYLKENEVYQGDLVFLN